MTKKIMTKANLESRLRMYNGKYPHIWIECKSIHDGKKIQKQIIENQLLRELLEERVLERTNTNTIFISTDYYANLADHVITEIFKSLLNQIGVQNK